MNEDYLKTKKEIKIEYNGSEKVIDLTKERKIFYNETLGYTCIEILKDEDNIEYDNLLKIERDIPIVKPDYFKDKEIYIPQYSKNDLSAGKILSSEKNKITHDCPITEDSLGLPLLSKDLDLTVFGIQKEYDENNKISIATSIVDILNDIKHQYCPFAFNDEIDPAYITDDIIKILRMFPKIEDNSFLSISSQKFNRNIPKLAFDLAENIKNWELYEDYQHEVINKFCRGTKIIFDSSKDSDTIINLLAKVYGKSNLVFYHSFTIYKPGIEDINESNQSKDLILLNGKIELKNDQFDFTKSDVFVYGNYRAIQINEYEFISFRNQNTSIFIKNKGDIIYIVFYRDYSTSFDVRAVIKVMNNFMTNKILMADTVFLDEEINDLKDLENKFLNKVEEWFENLDKEKKSDIDCNELIIYHIEE